MGEINKLQAGFVKMDVKSKKEEVNSVCQICFIEIDSNNKGYPQSNCSHIFHLECMKNYL